MKAGLCENENQRSNSRKRDGNWGPDIYDTADETDTLTIQHLS
jgi:hypothetical protein